MIVDSEPRWDLSETGSGSLMDALAELTRLAPVEDEPEAAELEGRWVIDDIAAASTLERLGTIAPGNREQRREQELRGPGRAPERVSLPSRPAPDPRDERGPASDPRDERGPSSDPRDNHGVPSVLDRIEAMPRFETDDRPTAHPTGKHWVQPSKRKLLGRPPS